MIPARSFLFLRHGQTDWNAQGRIQGRTDTDLNETGLAQARAAAQRLMGRGIQRIVSSPLKRALRTAEIVATALALPIELDEHLMERAFGGFEGRLFAEVRREHGIPPHHPVNTIMPADAEQWPQTCERARSVVVKWLDVYRDETLLFVSHGGVFLALQEQLIGVRPGATNAIPYAFTSAGGAWGISEVGAAV
jgi:broad specificity phosphatase PhoE